MSDKVKPCPWCRAIDIIFEPNEICCPIQYSAIGKCAACGAEAPEGSRVYTFKQDAIDEAIKAWNSRND